VHDVRREVVETPFFDPRRAEAPRLTRTAGVQWNVATGAWAPQVALDYRLFWGLSANAQGSWTVQPGQPPQLNLGVFRAF
jgi:hypothetical protein